LEVVMKFSSRSSLVAIGAASLALAAGVGPASAAPTVSDLKIKKPVDTPSNVLLTSRAAMRGHDEPLDEIYLNLELENVTITNYTP
jgi:hypothetical protein